MTRIKRLLTWVGALIVAAITTTIIASVISTQRVINALNTEGADIAFGPRFSMSAYDALHFGSLYVIFIFMAFVVAFFAGLLVFKFAKFGRPIVFIVAGAVAMCVMLMAMQEVFFGVPIVAGARDTFGLVLQMVAGAIGGGVFAALTAPKSTASISMDKIDT